MGISDEERREVARRMRELDALEFKEPAIVPFLECLGIGYVNWRGILDKLSDLIERQTCHDVGGGYEFRCSVCGCVIHIFRDGGFGEDDSAMTVGGDSLYAPRYCPNCCAMVTEEERRNVRKL